MINPIKRWRTRLAFKLWVSKSIDRNLESLLAEPDRDSAAGARAFGAVLGLMRFANGTKRRTTNDTLRNLRLPSDRHADEIAAAAQIANEHCQNKLDELGL
jgi:hypothetical protein